MTQAVTVVRIPRPEEDAFPWARAAGAALLGGALGLLLAYAGMERDRTADADEQIAAVEDGSETGGGGAPSPERAGDSAAPSSTAAPTSAGDPAGAADPTSTAAPGYEPESVRERTSASTDGPAPEGTEPQPALGAAPTGGEPASTRGTVGTASDRPLITGTAPARADAPAGGRVTMRAGRVAYLRCEGVPPRPGPFPCPRDEPLETAVWAALRGVEACGQAPGAGAADIVLDLAQGPPTIRARDTFPADTARTDGAALLACVSEPLQNVRSSLSARRLVVSFRLTLEAARP